MELGGMSASLDKSKMGATPATRADTGVPKPYLTAAGDLVIPSNSDPKYHWWKQGGQKVEKTVQELQATNGKAES